MFWFYMVGYGFFLCCFYYRDLFSFSTLLSFYLPTSDTGNSSVKKAPEWAVDASIYEVNIRQFTPEGTFRAFEEHLPRLKEMGVKILWLMPVHPIGEQNRKGGLGSYYSVKDYKAVNPEFGTLEDFRNLVQKTHELGMYLIIDWVANHSAFDCPLATQHPEWYQRDRKGQFVSPFDWTDVIAFDYSQQGIRNYMKETMFWWVKEMNIDGFRCDVAGMVPVDFWNSLRTKLEEVKPVFMLAEAEEIPLMEKAFDADYSWKLMNLMKEVYEGKKEAGLLHEYVMQTKMKYPAGSFKMNFTSNHDENSWAGTEYERYGNAALPLAVFTATIPGMPLIYNGQEEPMKKRLRFFEKDTIPFANYDLMNFYQTLFLLKQENAALWNGTKGGEYIPVDNIGGASVISFLRHKDNNRVFVVINLSDRETKASFKENQIFGKYRDAFNLTVP